MPSFEAQLLQYALQLGVTDARMINTAGIKVEDHLADICRDPGCPGFGRGANCPPHVMKPNAFRQLLKRFPRALVFKFDVPTEVLLGDARFEVSRLVHETAAAIESQAVAGGYTDARGLAAGSCKRIFCAGEKDCRVIADAGPCRHPDLARPSISGLGVNFFELARTVGWSIDKITRESDPDQVPMGLMAGIVLLAGDTSPGSKSLDNSG
jgi:predicted metal-binding protein